MWGCSLQSNFHFGALASKPHLRCAIAPLPRLMLMHVPTTQARSKHWRGLEERSHVSSGTSMRAQRMCCCSVLVSASKRTNADELTLHPSAQPWPGTECQR